jgi:hypothetical protein
VYPVNKSTEILFRYSKLNKGEPNFQSNFCICYIVDSPMQHEFVFVFLLLWCKPNEYKSETMKNEPYRVIDIQCMLS